MGIFDGLKRRKAADATKTAPSLSSELLAEIRQIEPTLTDIVVQQRPGADRNSVQVASVSGLVVASIALLNILRPVPAVIRAEIDALTRASSSLVGDGIVRLDQVILEPALAAEARAQCLDANLTNARMALTFAHNICGALDMERIRSLEGDAGGGPVLAVVVVLCDRLVGQERADNIFMDVASMVGKLTEAAMRAGN